MYDASRVNMQDPETQLPSIDPNVPLRKVDSPTRLRRYQLLNIAALRELHHYMQVQMSTLARWKVLAHEIATVLNYVGVPQLFQDFDLLHLTLIISFPLILTR
jgi:hypothetical protein